MPLRILKYTGRSAADQPLNYATPPLFQYTRSERAADFTSALQYLMAFCQPSICTLYVICFFDCVPESVGRHPAVLSMRDAVRKARPVVINAVLSQLYATFIGLTPRMSRTKPSLRTMETFAADESTRSTCSGGATVSRTLGRHWTHLTCDSRGACRVARAC